MKYVPFVCLDESNDLDGLSLSAGITFTSTTASPGPKLMFLLIDSPIFLLKYEIFLTTRWGSLPLGNSGELPRVMSTYSRELLPSEKESDWWFSLLYSLTKGGSGGKRCLIGFSSGGGQGALTKLHWWKVNSFIEWSLLGLNNISVYKVNKSNNH